MTPMWSAERQIAGVGNVLGPKIALAVATLLMTKKRKTENDSVLLNTEKKLMHVDANGGQQIRTIGLGSPSGISLET